MDNAHIWGLWVVAVSHGDLQAEISRKIGVPNSTVSRWLRGVVAKPSPVHAAQLAQAYGREPIEAFVAGGILEPEAGAAILSPDAIKTLTKLGVKFPATKKTSRHSA